MKNINVFLTIGFIISLVICTIINNWLGVGLLVGGAFGFIIAITTILAQYIKNKEDVINLLEDFKNNQNI